MSDDCCDKRKQSLYLPEDMLHEVQVEAKRLDRSLSWVLQFAWKFGRKHVREIPDLEFPCP